MAIYDWTKSKRTEGRPDARALIRVRFLADYFVCFQVNFSTPAFPFLTAAEHACIHAYNVHACVHAEEKRRWSPPPRTHFLKANARSKKGSSLFSKKTSAPFWDPQVAGNKTETSGLKRSWWPKRWSPGTNPDSKPSKAPR